MNNLFFFFGLLSLLAASSAMAGLTNAVYWNFSAGGSSPSSNSLSGLTVADISQGNSKGAVTMLNGSSVSSGYTTTAGFAASGTTNAGIAVRTNALNISQANTNAFFATSLSLDLLSAYTLTVTNFSLGSRSTGTGPTLLSLYTSTDGFASIFSFIGSFSVAANSLYSPVDFGQLNISIGLGDTLSFRLYGSDGVGVATAGTANWRIDDVGISYSLTPVPEPSTASLALLGGFSVLGFSVFRRRQ